MRRSQANWSKWRSHLRLEHNFGLYKGLSRYATSHSLFCRATNSSVKLAHPRSKDGILDEPACRLTPSMILTAGRAAFLHSVILAAYVGFFLASSPRSLSLQT